MLGGCGTLSDECFHQHPNHHGAGVGKTERAIFREAVHQSVVEVAKGFTPQLSDGCRLASQRWG